MKRGILGNLLLMGLLLSAEIDDRPGDFMEESKERKRNPDFTPTKLSREFGMNRRQRRKAKRK